MRAIRRGVKRRYAGWRNRGRRLELEAQLAQALGEPVSLVPAGARGRDSIYFARGHDRVLGVLRQFNPYLRRTPVPRDMPYVELDGPARLEREWNCYAVGHRAGLTPEPLWRTEDAILCGYLHGKRMSDRQFESPGDLWELICMGSVALRSLHAAGLVHMDACLANILLSREGPSCRFIDFEYGPAPALSEPQQRVYDHLRLVESSIKFLPPEAAGGHHEWLRVVDESLGPQARETDITPLAPGLRRLLDHPEIGPAVRSLLPRNGG